MKQLLQNIRDGKAVVEEVPVPSPRKGMALIQTAASPRFGRHRADGGRIRREVAGRQGPLPPRPGPPGAGESPPRRRGHHPPGGLQPPRPADGAGILLRRDDRRVGRGHAGLPGGRPGGLRGRRVRRARRIRRGAAQPACEIARGRGFQVGGLRHPGRDRHAWLPPGRAAGGRARGCDRPGPAGAARRADRRRGRVQRAGH